MAHALRTTELRASLQRELAAASTRGRFDPRGELRWLHGELTNYLDRWLAFAAIESIPMKSLLADDLFAMVVVAADEFRARRRALPDHAALQAWERFDSGIGGLRPTEARASLVGLQTALAEVGAALRDAGAIDSG